jgi:DNA-binding response OmpR family regulator
MMGLLQPTLSHALRDRRILVVEDDFFLAEHVAEILRSAGASVVGPYSNITDALENLDKYVALDAAVMDIGLTDGESFPLAEAFQLTKLPFVFLTGREKASLPPGFDRSHHILKPFREEDLIATVAAISEH